MIEPFIYDHWYICAWREELTTNPLQRWILNQPIALFRTESGEPAAIADRCPHRGAPLTSGTVRGEALECGYHGLTFDKTGKCVRVRGRDNIPPTFATRAYPIVEKWRFAFIWMGDPDKADESKIPDYHWSDDENWAARGETLPVKCHASLLRDNLLDLSHAHYVHANTLATDAVVRVPIEVEERKEEVIVQRHMVDIHPSPFFSRVLGGFDGKVNHLQVVRFLSASNIIIEVSVSSVENPEHKAELRVMNSLTPETERSSHYFWSLARNMHLNNDSLGDWIFTANRDTFFEDIDIVEQQQILLEKAPAPQHETLFHVDGGVNAGRKLHARLAAEENNQID